jgi:glycogen debranching enzyme
MFRSVLFCSASLALLLALPSAIHAQTPASPAPFTSLQPLPFDTSGPVLRAPAQPQKPFTVAGPRGVLVGQQDGTFEAWVLPVKLLSHLTIEARIQGYSVPVDVNPQAAQIEVRPDRTILTYSHIGFTVRQIMFVPPATTKASGAATGPVVLFEFDCLHPTDFIFRFTPNLAWMWPQRNEGVPGVEWVAPDPRNPAVPHGFYAFHTDYPDLAAALTIPGAEPGILAPYQERPKDYPVELKLHIDPARDHGRLFPLLMAVGLNAPTATNAALGSTLARLNADIPALYASQAQTYKDVLAHSVSIETPDKSLDEAFQWAIVSIEQLKTHVPNTDETALVAGYYSSADSARPGFGWFFGRDALYTLYAVNGYGDFALTRAELEFLIHRQRADGKIMHEYSQTAGAVDWQQFPYQWAAADATPLFLLAVADYVRASGDTTFLAAHRDAVEKAWAFETDPAHDTDHDGIYDNSQGTGWVESWPGGMPHQEVYLALLDQQASSAYAYLQTQLKDDAKAKAAEQRATTLAKTINTEYYDSDKSCYAFSRNVAPDGTASLDRTRTVYPALAWWDPANNKAILDQPEPCLRQFAASSINTDWGTRDVANDEKIYDGMSYHQGSVWPLFTGWAALAEYRANQPLAGYQLLKENANLTRAQDLGAHTELLSGDFYVPMGRSTSHQLWSSAMVITPTLRGLFGLSIDAATKTITVNPHLPASWDHADVMHLPLPGTNTRLSFKRNGNQLEVSASLNEDNGWHLRSDLPGATFGAIDKEVAKKLATTPGSGLRIPLPAIEVDETAGPYGDATIESVSLLNKPPEPGTRQRRFHILNATYSDHKLVLTAEGLADTDAIVTLIRHGHIDPKVQSAPPAPANAERENAVISHRECDADFYACKELPMILHFPAGTGFQTLTVTLTW